MKHSPYSYSRLNSYKVCPRKFKYTYISKLKPQKLDRTALLKGGAVHSIIENYPEKSKHKLAPKYQHVFDKFIETELGKKYLSKESVREFEFGLTEDLEITSYSDKKAMFRGSVDFVCIVDNVLHLIDWKTGKYKEPKFQDYTQLMYYGIYFFKKFENINTMRITYVYVEHPEHENDLILERKFVDNYVNDLKSTINSVESDTEFCKNISSLCKYCDFEDHCVFDI